jgi:hypothetical protein
MPLKRIHTVWVSFLLDEEIDAEGCYMGHFISCFISYFAQKIRKLVKS